MKGGVVSNQRQKAEQLSMYPNHVAAEGLESRTMLTAVVGLLPSNQIAVFDSASPGVILAKRTVQMPKGETLTSIDYEFAGGLYGVSQTHQFYLIAPETGVAALAGPLIPAAAGERVTIDMELPSGNHTPRAIGRSRGQVEGAGNEVLL